MIKQLEQELFWLKKELAMHDALTNRPQVSYDPPTEVQRFEILRQAKQFLDGQVNEIEVSLFLSSFTCLWHLLSGLLDIDHRNNRTRTNVKSW